MVCIYCSGKTQVMNSRSQKRTNSTWRRRQCLTCSAIFTTIEWPDLGSALRVSHSGKLEPFNQPQLFVSIYECCKHLEKPTYAAEHLTNTVIGDLLDMQVAILERSELIKAVNNVLNHFDKAAALQYAAYHK